MDFMSVLDYLVKRYKIDLPGKMPVFIPGDRNIDFPEMFKELEFKLGAEIGTEKGIYAETLVKDNPSLKLFCIDPWKAYEGYREHVNQENLDGFYNETKQRLAKYNCHIIRGFSENVCTFFADGTLDFVYIDANHEFLSVAKDLTFWIPKVRAGGIVAGHDFRRNSGAYVNDVKDVVPAYAYAKKINPWFVLREERAASSWFWVKG